MSATRRACTVLVDGSRVTSCLTLAVRLEGAEHAFARMKSWKILRDCRLKGGGAHHAVLGIARLHNLTLAG